MTERAYFDWNATAPLRAEARDAMLAAQHIVAHTQTQAREPEHPIQIMARAFGLKKE